MASSPRARLSPVEDQPVDEVEGAARVVRVDVERVLSLPPPAMEVTFEHTQTLPRARLSVIGRPQPSLKLGKAVKRHEL